MAHASNATGAFGPGEALSESSGGVLYLPPTFLDAFIPGYSVLAKALFDFAGVDISFYVSLCALVFVLHAAWNFTVAPLRDAVLKFLTSAVYIDEYDDIYDQVLNWVRAHRLMSDLRSLRAESQGRYYDYDDDESDMASDLGPGIIFNFNDWAARAAPKYEPHTSSGFFYHKGYFYRIIRDREKVQDDWGPTVREREKLIVSVLWRSTLPIKALIEESREFYLGKRTSHTRIYRPVAREERSHNNEWHIVAVRPSRPMATVVLDDEPKAQILLDLNEFLHPKTARWYANRGIPYRRGYLFHGPPGTGKSSMSFSLAGLFGLNIYCLSLSEVTLTEESLIVLFNTLPKRCIVLLEDIDSAGISRPNPPGEKAKSKRKKDKKKKKDKTSSKADTEASGDEVALPGAPKKLTNAISISGLLNAIDGVASQEGRILIMTTNHPGRLDHALVRPGRVDMQIRFDLASRQQIKELFLRMYSADTVSSGRQATKIAEVMPHMDLQRLIDAGGDLEIEPQPSSSDDSGYAAPSAEKDSPASSPAPLKRYTFDAELDSLADQFAHALPGGIFSPAEVQGYLLTRKKGPRRAVAEVPGFRDEQIASKTARALEETRKEQNGEVVKPGADAARRATPGTEKERTVLTPKESSDCSSDSGSDSGSDSDSS